MQPIISVQDLGKKYTIRHADQAQHYTTLREELFKLPGRLLHRGRQNKEEFWALKDVSFDIMPGDRVGIIGRNGAGKSTLLKLLSRITEPTTGKITLRGRVASLLEVGTGFHPELTGRENIYLNGAILGMSRAEVRSKFDEIVDFAGVEKFLDTPVKRYSSGMYVRLAFAVAAHLEPEILIVDEVLAVGDAEFQKKCLGKMEQIGKSGRTVLFVSHNMAAVMNLCQYGVFLESGNVKEFNEIDIVVNEYYKYLDPVLVYDACNNSKYIKKIWFENAQHHVANTFEMSSSFSIRVKIAGPLKNVVLGFVIKNISGMRIGSYSTLYQEDFLSCNIEKESIFSFKMNACKLLADEYVLSFYIGDISEQCIDSAENCIRFKIVNTNIFNTGREYAPSHGVCYFDIDFSQETCSDTA